MNYFPTDFKCFQALCPLSSFHPKSADCIPQVQLSFKIRNCKEMEILPVKYFVSQLKKK